MEFWLTVDHSENKNINKNSTNININTSNHKLLKVKVSKHYSITFKNIGGGINNSF